MKCFRCQPSKTRRWRGTGCRDGNGLGRLSPGNNRQSHGQAKREWAQQPTGRGHGRLRQLGLRGGFLQGRRSRLQWLRQRLRHPQHAQASSSSDTPRPRVGPSRRLKQIAITSSTEISTKFTTVGVILRVQRGKGFQILSIYQLTLPTVTGSSCAMFTDFKNWLKLKYILGSMYSAFPYLSRARSFLIGQKCSHV